MSESEGFLSRWSRLKSETSRATGDPAIEPLAHGPSPDGTTEGSRPNGATGGSGPHSATNSAADSATAGPPPAVDLASLPPVESIGPGTDIRAFLQAGVPAELVRAALRSAWSTDPQIREFIEIADNQWDFNAADGIPGFGALGVADASRSLVSRALESSDEVLSVARQVSSGSVGLLPPAPVPVTEPEVHDEVWRAGGVTPPRVEVTFDAAPGSGDTSAKVIDTSATDAEPGVTKRSHGGALPRC
jgi:hypothetical protein